MCNEGEMRLVDGDIEQEGRPEVCWNGVWGNICDDVWQEVDAYILCRQLGYDGGVGTLKTLALVCYDSIFINVAPVAMNASFFGDGLYPTVWSQVNCGGWEKDLGDCPRKDYLKFPTCSRGAIAGVRCAEGIYQDAIVNHSID